MQQLLTAVVFAVMLCTGARAGEEPPPEQFPENLLGNPEYMEIGKKAFDSICKFCHGKAAYPGKAPRLDPSRYTPLFVYDRITNGFRGMPPWKEQFSEKERQALTVYIMSQGFSN